MRWVVESEDGRWWLVAGGWCLIAVIPRSGATRDLLLSPRGTLPDGAYPRWTQMTLTTRRCRRTRTGNALEKAVAALLLFLRNLRNLRSLPSLARDTSRPRGAIAPTTNHQPPSTN